MVNTKMHLKPGESLQGKRGKEDLYDCYHSKIAFSDAYVLGGKIAEGNFGIVYYTHHVSSSDCFDDDDHKGQYAVKVIKRSNDGAHDEEAIHEVNIMCQLRHAPTVIQLIDFYMDDEKLYIVQSLALGGDVFDRLAERKHYTEKTARSLSQSLLHTIGYIHHRKIIHRDLKIENLLLKTVEDDDKVVLCDFGYAANLPKDKEEGFTTLAGTAAYYAPEMLLRNVYREEVDVWAVGCIVYALLGGNVPFGEAGETEDDLAELHERIEQNDFDFEDTNWDDVSGSAKKLISKLLVPDPFQRSTISQALKSSWFESPDLEKISIHDSLKRIRVFVRRRKLKAAANAIRVSNRILHSHTGMMSHKRTE